MYLFTKKPSRPRLNLRYIKTPIETIIDDEIVNIENLSQMNAMTQDSFSLLSDEDMKRLALYFADLVSYINRNQKSLRERNLNQIADASAERLRVLIPSVKSKIKAELQRRSELAFYQKYSRRLK